MFYDWQPLCKVFQNFPQLCNLPLNVFLLTKFCVDHRCRSQKAQKPISFGKEKPKRDELIGQSLLQTAQVKFVFISHRWEMKMFIQQYPHGRKLILFFSRFLTFWFLESFELHIPLQTVNHYSLLGDCKWASLYIYKCSPRQEHTYLPRFAFCIPGYLPISGPPHASSLAFLIIACKTIFLHNLLR